MNSLEQPATPNRRSPASGLLDCPTCGTQPETRNWHTYCPKCGREAAFGETPWECEQIWNAMIAGQSNNQAHRSAPEADVERNKTKGKSNEQ